MKEIWKDVVGFEDYFEVSNTGKVKSKSRMVNNNGCMVFKESRILKPFYTKAGYMQLTLYVDGLNFKKYVHRLVSEAFIYNEFNLPEVNHIDHNKSNNNSYNLEWCNRRYNAIKYHEFYGTRKEINYCDNCGKEVYGDSILCSECNRFNNRKSARPSKEELLELIKSKTFIEIGKMYNVSDNAIRKWCKDYNLPYRKKDIKMLDK